MEQIDTNSTMQASIQMNKLLLNEASKLLLAVKLLVLKLTIYTGRDVNGIERFTIPGHCEALADIR